MNIFLVLLKYKSLLDLYLIFRVHATVKTLEFSIVPHEIITAGSGYKNVPGFQFILLIYFLPPCFVIIYFIVNECKYDILFSLNQVII